MSQVSRLKEHLENGSTLTRLSALTELGIFELSSRVIALERGGYPVKKERVKITNRWGESISVVRYSKG